MRRAYIAPCSMKGLMETRMNNDSDILGKYGVFRELVKELQSDALGDISKPTMLQAGRKHFLSERNQKVCLLGNIKERSAV